MTATTEWCMLAEIDVIMDKTGNVVVKGAYDED